MLIGNHSFYSRIFSAPATSNEDAVLKPGNEAAAHRKQWGKPHVTQIISALGNAKLQTATTTIGPDEPDAPKKAHLPVVMQSSGNGDGSAMGATVTVQKPSTPSPLGATVVKSPTSDSPKPIIARRDKMDENKEGDDGVEGHAISGNADEDTKKPVVGMETILEGTSEGEKETKTISSDASGSISLEEVETITDHKEEPKAQEKPTPKSPVKAWGEVKASPPTESKDIYRSYRIKK